MRNDSTGNINKKVRLFRQNLQALPGFIKKTAIHIFAVHASQEYIDFPGAAIVNYYTGNGEEPAPLHRMSVPVFHCQLSETESQKSYDHCQHYQPEGISSGHQPCH